MNPFDAFFQWFGLSGFQLRFLTRKQQKCLCSNPACVGTQQTITMKVHLVRLPNEPDSAQVQVIDDVGKEIVLVS